MFHLTNIINLGASGLICAFKIFNDYMYDFVFPFIFLDSIGRKSSWWAKCDFYLQVYIVSVVFINNGLLWIWPTMQVCPVLNLPLLSASKSEAVLAVKYHYTVLPIARFRHINQKRISYKHFWPLLESSYFWFFFYLKEQLW